MLVTSNPILTTDSLGPSAGTLILGRLMDDQMLAEMRERTEVDFAWYPCDEHDSMHGSLTEEVGSESLGGMAIRRIESSIDTHSILFDVNGEALLVFEANACS